MDIKTITTLAFLMPASAALAVDSPIGGTVAPKCSVWTETSGVYGHPLPYKLSTTTADGGVNDAVAWTGSTVVGQVSVAGMSAYEAAKVTYNNVTEFNMTLAGSTWFTVASTASYGSTKSLPAGNYTAIIKAECIAK